jgi:hypothetical protein
VGIHTKLHRNYKTVKKLNFVISVIILRQVVPTSSVERALPGKDYAKSFEVYGGCCSDCGLLDSDTMQSH